MHRLRTVVVLMLLALLPSGSVGDVPRPTLVPAAKGEQCVEPTDVIRRDHMKFLLHQRDETTRHGIRTKRHSLAGCVDCHAAADASGQVQRVDAPGQFCAACHAYTAVKIDCFECHAATPDGSGGHQ